MMMAKKLMGCKNVTEEELTWFRKTEVGRALTDLFVYYELEEEMYDIWVVVRNDDLNEPLRIEPLEVHTYRNRRMVKNHEPLPQERILFFGSKEECETW